MIDIIIATYWTFRAGKTVTIRNAYHNLNKFIIYNMILVCVRLCLKYLKVR